MREESDLQNLKDLSENLSDGIALHKMIYDEDGKAIDYKILYTNPSYLIHTGIPEAEGKLASEVYGLKNGQHPFIDIFETVVKSGVPVVFEDSFLDRNYHVVVSSPLDGHFLTRFCDITHQKSVEASLREMESRLSLAQKAASTGVWDWDLKSGKMFWSKELYELFGLDLDNEASIETWESVTYPDDRSITSSFLRSLSLNLAPATNQYRIIHRNGTLRWISSLGAATVDDNGKPIRVSGICLDVTEQKETEDALVESNKRLQLATEAAKAGVWEWDPRTNFIIWDNQMLNLYGASTHPKGIEGWISYIHKEDSNRVVVEFEKCIQNSDLEFDTEFRIVLHDGKIKFMRANGTVIRDFEGHPIRMIGLNIDITDKRKEELRRQRLEIEVQHAQKLESLGSLAGGVAHDMNNVLTAIIGISDTLLYRNQENDSIANPLQTVIKAANRGRDLVKSLINFARKDIASVQVLDLNQIVLSETAILERTTLQKIQLSSNLYPDLPKIKGDPSAITSAIMNLCINSIDAMPEGGTVKISTNYVDGMVEIVVEDDGEGMSQEVLDRAVEPFFTTKPFGKGTGLGLAMVYGTMKAHHGKLDISSKVGVGTKITLKFLPYLEESTILTAQTEKIVKSVSLNILLVDDDELIRKTLPEMMEIYGHTISTVESGIKALEILKEENSFDLVILDINMPIMGGLETLRRLREFSSVLVLVSTGFLDPEVEDILKQDSRSDYINKPFSLLELRKSINRVLERNPQSEKV